MMNIFETNNWLDCELFTFLTSNIQLINMNKLLFFCQMNEKLIFVSCIFETVTSFCQVQFSPRTVPFQKKKKKLPKGLIILAFPSNVYIPYVKLFT